MFSLFERMVAFRYLRSRRKEGFISVITAFSFLGITLGVGTLIVVMAVMNGFHKELLERILGINSHISLYGIERPVDNYDSLIVSLKTIPRIQDISPIIEGQVMAVGRGNASNGAIVRAMRPEDLKRKELVAKNIINGDLDNFGGKDVVILGNILARQLGVTVGDIVTLISPKTTATVMGSIPRLKEYRIIGLFDVGMHEYNSTTIFMPLEAGQLYFKFPDSVNRIDVMLESPKETEEISLAIIEKTLGKYLVQDWKQSNSSYFGALKVERNVMFLILTLIILVAAFNIISSMIMLVKDKGRDIAILRTMGATKGMIMRIFLLSGSVIGIIGTLTGFAAGLAFALNIESIRRLVEKLIGTELFSAEIYYLTRLPADVQSSDVIQVVLMSLIISILAPIYPAWRAAKMDPVEGIRYE